MLYVLARKSLLVLVVHLDSILTKNAFKLFSEQSCHIVCSRIIITWDNVYLTPHLAEDCFPSTISTWYHIYQNEDYEE